VAWHLEALRKPKREQPLLDDWEERCDPRVLRRRLAKYERYLRSAGGWGATTTRAQELQQIVTRLTDRTRLFELEEYEVKMREWQERHREDPRLWHGKTRPKRPGWLKEVDTDERIQAARERRIEAPLQPLAPDPRQVRLARNLAESNARDARKRAQQHDALESRVHELLDWVWGECRLMHVGEEIDGWLYVDDEHGIPRATTPTRAAALAACAVRLSTGWAFPPETARGRA
jgi:hypothetical protein